MPAIASLTEDALRGRPVRLRVLGVMGCACGIAYGAVMGSWGGLRAAQIAYSAVKVPMLLTVAFLIAMPSFFVLNTLAGVRGDFRRVLALLGRAQATGGLVLAALAPLTAFWYASFAGYEAAVTFNALMFAAASLAAQGVLRRGYAELARRNPVHRKLLMAWIVIYGFVGVQMGWVLRPFVGSPGKATTFFREGAWGNAYVEVAKIAWRAVGG